MRCAMPTILVGPEQRAQLLELIKQLLDDETISSMRMETNYDPIELVGFGEREYYPTRWATTTIMIEHSMGDKKPKPPKRIYKEGRLIDL